MNFTIEIAKKENQGEDAPPIFMTSTDKINSIVAVLDGLGGSGSNLYEEDGVVRTGAYISSRVVGATITRFFENFINNGDFKITGELILELKQIVKTDLETKLKTQKYEQSKLKSSLIRTFPTTLAMGVTTINKDSAKVDIIWAGDSRIYLLKPEDGLIQLTKDDLKINNDPYENIGNDSPLSNMIHLDEDFNLNYFVHEVKNPFFIIAATDGCFGYYPTPMHFEYLLISSLQGSNSEIEWKDKIIDELKNISGDDFSLSLKYVSDTEIDFSQIKENFRVRSEKLYQQFMKDILKSEADLNELKRKKDEYLENYIRMTEENKIKNKLLWDEYKTINYPSTKTGS
jgi:serine/threonine protein phosphatase PrpC